MVKREQETGNRVVLEEDLDLPQNACLLRRGFIPKWFRVIDNSPEAGIVIYDATTNAILNLCESARNH